MPDICKYEGNRVLLVEGINDCHSILALCKAYNLPQTFGIYQCGNDIRILKRMNALIVQPDPPESISIVIDVDAGNIQNRWLQIKDKLKDHNYCFPDLPDSQGTVITGSINQSINPN